MSHLADVIKAARKRTGKPASVSSTPKDGRLGKAISAASEAIGMRKSSPSPESLEFDLIKGAHDAMFHHAEHAAAAQRSMYGAGYTNEDNDRCKEAAKKHTFMFLRHALENARNRDSYSMKSALQSALQYYEREAQDEMYSIPQDSDPVLAHFRKGGGFVPHATDSDFIEDYEGSKIGPNTKRKGSK